MSEALVFRAGWRVKIGLLAEVEIFTSPGEHPKVREGLTQLTSRIEAFLLQNDRIEVSCAAGCTNPAEVTIEPATATLPGSLVDALKAQALVGARQLDMASRFVEQISEKSLEEAVEEYIQQARRGGESLGTMVIKIEVVEATGFVTTLSPNRPEFAATLLSGMRVERDVDGRLVLRITGFPNVLPFADWVARRLHDRTLAAFTKTLGLFPKQTDALVQ